MEQKQANDVMEIDLRGLFEALWDKKWMIALSGIVLALCAGLASEFLVTDMYESETQVYVMNQQDNNTITYSDLQSGAQLSKDYKELITTRTVLEKAIYQLDLPMDYTELARTVSAEVLPDTRILSITVTNASPSLARDLAIAVRDAASIHISEVMEVAPLNTVQEANLPESPSNANLTRNTLMGGLLGAIIAAGIVFLIYILDDTIKSTEDAERYLNAAVLGIIPVRESEQGKKKTNPSQIKVRKVG